MIKLITFKYKDKSRYLLFKNKNRETLPIHISLNNSLVTIYDRREKMIELSTTRLRLIPLNAKYLDLLIHGEKKLEMALSVRSKEVYLDEELRQALKFRLAKVLGDEQNYFWHTNWLIVSKETSSIVGGIMLKGLPNEHGDIVIGYYTFPLYQGKGYMTEAVRMMKDWLLRQSNVKYVMADTDKNNIASHKVLQKAGAILYSESEELFFWRFE